jgi:hypothetical protein
VLGTWKDKLKGKDKFETWENYLMLTIFVGAITLSVGIGLTIITPKGIPAIVAMLGSLVSFLAAVGLIVLWILKEFFGETHG